MSFWNRFVRLFKRPSETPVPVEVREVALDAEIVDPLAHVNTKQDIKDVVMQVHLMHMTMHTAAMQGMVDPPWLLALSRHKARHAPKQRAGRADRAYSCLSSCWYAEVPLEGWRLLMSRVGGSSRQPPPCVVLSSTHRQPSRTCHLQSPRRRTSTSAPSGRWRLPARSFRRPWTPWCDRSRWVHGASCAGRPPDAPAKHRLGG